jgi:hypothetical protein
MSHSQLRRLGGVTLVGVLLAYGASAQPAVRSFDELQSELNAGQTVFVTDAGGRHTKGKVVDISGSTLVIRTPETRTFTDVAITDIKITDSRWDGVLIGAGVGIGLAIWDYSIDPSEPGNAAIFAIGTGLGAAIGAGIDALRARPGRTIYRSPRVAVSPMVGPVRHGLSMSVRF